MQPESNTPQVKEEAGRRDPATLDPRKKASLAKLFMHNPPSSPYFQDARRGIEGNNGSKSRGDLDPPLSIL
jgi:hypothetical protein